MYNLFKELDESMNLDELQKDIKALDRDVTSKKEYKVVPFGKYEVKVNSITMGVTKSSNKPVLKIQFKILNGSYQNSVLFMDQVLEKPFQFKVANDFLVSLRSQQDIEFKGYVQYAQLFENIIVDIANNEYVLDYSEVKGFKTFKIEQVFLPDNLPF